LFPDLAVEVQEWERDGWPGTTWEQTLGFVKGLFEDGSLDPYREPFQLYGADLAAVSLGFGLIVPSPHAPWFYAGLSAHPAYHAANTTPRSPKSGYDL